METIFIGYPKCSTCRKAYKTLTDLGIQATYRDISVDNPSADEIKEWIQAGVPLASLFNTSGKLYREYKIKEKRLTYTDDQLIDILASDGMLVKRPIVIQGEQILVGNQMDRYEKMLKK